MLQARVRELWKAGHQHRWPRLGYHQVGSPTALPLQDMRGNRQHEHGHSVFRPSLHSQGVRPSSEPAGRGREHFCHGPSHGSFPQHRRTLARACLSGGRALQPAHAAVLPPLSVGEMTRCLRCLLLVMCTYPFAKKALTLHLARGEGRERYFGCNLMQRKVLASSHQHLMAEPPESVGQASAAAKQLGDRVLCQNSALLK